VPPLVRPFTTGVVSMCSALYLPYISRISPIYLPIYLPPEP